MSNNDNTKNKSWVPAAVGTAAVLGGGALGLRHLGKGSISAGATRVGKAVKKPFKMAHYNLGATTALCKLGLMPEKDDTSKLTEKPPAVSRYFEPGGYAEGDMPPWLQQTLENLPEKPPAVSGYFEAPRYAKGDPGPSWLQKYLYGPAFSGAYEAPSGKGAEGFGRGVLESMKYTLPLHVGGAITGGLAGFGVGKLIGKDPALSAIIGNSIGSLAGDVTGNAIATGKTYEKVRHPDY